MKKLMIVLAAVATAVVANAASFSWSAPAGRLLNGTGNVGAANYVAEGTSAYLLVASELSQTDLVSGYNAAGGASYASTVAGRALSTGAVNASARIDSASFTSSVTTDQTVYFVVFYGDNMYVSDTVTATYLAVGTSDVEFGSLTASSKSLPADATAGFGSAGWYTAAAVPEPTSGLLMLLGMAGLALKRRRA